MRRAALLIACIAPLAACNKSPEIHAKNASVEQVMDAAREAGANSGMILRAGQWRLTTTMEDMSMPGMSPSMQAEMKSMMGQRQNVRVDYCMTPEDARRPSGKVFTGQESKNCRYERFNMAGGKVDAVMHCEAKPAGTTTMTISGTFSPDSYTNDVRIESTGGRRGGMTMKMRSEAHRIGDCTGKPGDVKVTMHGGEQ